MALRCKKCICIELQCVGDPAHLSAIQIDISGYVTENGVKEGSLNYTEEIPIANS